MSAETKEKAVKPNTFFKTWFAFDELVRAKFITETQQRELFWGALSINDQNELTRQCPYFDSHHAVWTESDSAMPKRAMTELSAIMRGKRTHWRSIISIRVMIGAFFGCATSGVISQVIGICKPTGFAMDGWTIAYICLFSMGPVISLFAHIVHTRTRRSLRGSESDYPPVSRGPQYRETPLTDTQRQYMKNWAVTHNWSLIRADGKCSDLWLWGELSSLVDDGKITSCERRQIFWDSHTIEQKAALMKWSPFFHIGHEVWSSGTLDQVRRAKLRIDIAALAWEIQSTKHARTHCIQAALGVLLGGAVVSALTWFFALRAFGQPESKAITCAVMVVVCIVLPVEGLITVRAVLKQVALTAARSKQSDLKAELEGEVP